MPPFTITAAPMPSMVGRSDLERYLLIGAQMNALRRSIGPPDVNLLDFCVAQICANMCRPWIGLVCGPRCAISGIVFCYTILRKVCSRFPRHWSRSLQLYLDR